MTALDDRLNDINRQFVRYRRIIAGVLVIGALVNGALFVVLAGPERPGQTLMELELDADWTPPAVCPGERIVVDYTVHIRGAGVFDIDRSLWRVSPPATVIFSETRHAVYPGPVVFPARREWLVPHTYVNPIDDKPAALAPGEYAYYWALSTSSRSTTPSILTVPFTVKGDCP